MEIQKDYSIPVTLPPTPDCVASHRIAHVPALHDRHLVEAAQSGCRVAFNELCNLYSQRLYRTILGITNNPHDAEDALQDSFLRAFIALSSFEGRSSFYSWLTRIAINSALGILRKRRSRQETSLDSDDRQDDRSTFEECRDLAPDPEQAYEQQERREKLMQGIRELPPDLRLAAEARITKDCSIKEVASHLNISEASAKIRLYRAKMMLASMTASSYRPRSLVN